MPRNVEADSNHGKVSAATSKRSPPMKKDLICRYCNKKFSNYQALGGHQNAHKDERAAAQKEKILSMASAYNNKNSYDVDGFANVVNPNQSYYGFGGKTLRLSPLSMTSFKPLHVSSNWPHHHMGHVLKSVQVLPTIHQLQTWMAEGSGFYHQHQHNKSRQTLNFPILREGALKKNCLIHSEAFYPILCDKGNDNNIGQASNSSIIMPQNESNSFSSMLAANEEVKELDLTLKI